MLSGSGVFSPSPECQVNVVLNVISSLTPEPVYDTRERFGTRAVIGQPRGYQPSVIARLPEVRMAG